MEKTPPAKKWNRSLSEHIGESINRLVAVMDNGKDYICYVCECEFDERKPCPICNQCTCIEEEKKKCPKCQLDWKILMTMRKTECLTKMMDAREKAIEEERGW